MSAAPRVAAKKAWWAHAFQPAVITLLSTIAVGGFVFLWNLHGDYSKLLTQQEDDRISLSKQFEAEHSFAVQQFANVTTQFQNIDQANGARFVADEGRISRIAESIPIIDARVAEMDLYRNYSWALIRKTADADSGITLFDFNTNKQEHWLPTNSTPGSLGMMAVILAGAVSDTGGRVLSFDKLSAEAAIAKVSARPSANVDQEVSWVGTGDLAGVRKKLAVVGWSATPAVTILRSPGENTTYEGIVKTVMVDLR